MKTFLVLDPTVQIALISTIGGLLTIIIIALVPLLKKVLNNQIEFMDVQKKLVVKTDGLLAELVKTTKALGIEEGKQIGKAELKVEQKDDIIKVQIETNRQDIEKMKSNPEPTQVIVTNAEPLPVVVTKEVKK